MSSFILLLALLEPNCAGSSYFRGSSLSLLNSLTLPLPPPQRFIAFLGLFCSFFRFLLSRIFIFFPISAVIQHLASPRCGIIVFVYYIDRDFDNFSPECFTVVYVKINQQAEDTKKRNAQLSIFLGVSRFSNSASHIINNY